MLDFLKGIILSAVLVFAPIQGVLVTVLVLTLVDLITGIIAARKVGEKITSRGIRRTVVKLFVYQVACCCAFLCETYLTGSIVPCLKILTTLIGLTELKSVLENLDKIYGINIFKSVVDRLMGGKDDKTS
jgi:phage-related holin